MQGNFIKGLVKVSSPFLIGFGMLSFIVLGIYAADYYSELNARRFGSFGGLMLGICLSLIIEGGRFAFLLASVRDFAIGNKKNGWLGLIASVFLVVHDITVSWKIAHLWSATNALDYFNCFLFLVMFGLFVEIRLVMAYGSKSSSSPTPSDVSSSGVSEGKVSRSEPVGAGATDS